MTGQPSHLLVYGPRKSGTSLFQSLLDGHPEVAMSPGELKLKYLAHRNFIEADRRASYYYRRGRSFFPRDIESVDPDDLLEAMFSTLAPSQVQDRFAIETYLKRSREALNREGEFPDLIDGDLRNFTAATREPSQPSYQGAKEVGDGGRTRPVLNYFRSHFPNALVLVILRKPKFVLSSITRARRKHGNPLGPRRFFREWKATNHTIHHLGHEDLLSSPQVHYTFYEDLVTETEQTMRDVSEFLGIDFDDILTKPTQLGLVATVHTSSRDAAKVFADSAEDWTRGLSIREQARIRLFQDYATSLFESWKGDLNTYDGIRRTVA